mmetsp:Transcript_113054/g.258991  ORF Transcript_113054/g.258991 Transcript_113054/m.258991 type:complete len:232 (-) Transcript_113054:174-869(-)
MAHRDIQACNVYVGVSGEESGVVKLSGMYAAVPRVHNACKTRPRVRPNKPYTAPEFLLLPKLEDVTMETKDIDGAAMDMWAMGVVLLHADSGSDSVRSLSGWFDGWMREVEEARERDGFGPAVLEQLRLKIHDECSQLTLQLSQGGAGAASFLGFLLVGAHRRVSVAALNFLALALPASTRQCWDPLLKGDWVAGAVGAGANMSPPNWDDFYGVLPLGQEEPALLGRPLER